MIVRKHGKIILYCKGADSMIKERLDPSEKDMITITNDYLHVYIYITFIRSFSI